MPSLTGFMYALTPIRTYVQVTFPPFCNPIQGVHFYRRPWSCDNRTSKGVGSSADPQPVNIDHSPNLAVESLINGGSSKFGQSYQSGGLDDDEKDTDIVSTSSGQICPISGTKMSILER